MGVHAVPFFFVTTNVGSAVKKFTRSFDFDINQIALVSGGLHLLLHHPACDGEDNPLRKQIIALRRMMLEKLPEDPPPNETWESDEDTLQLVDQVTECVYAEMLFDTYKTVREMGSRHAQLALQQMFTEVHDRILEEKLENTDNLPKQ